MQDLALSPFLPPLIGSGQVKRGSTLPEPTAPQDAVSANQTTPPAFTLTKETFPSSAEQQTSSSTPTRAQELQNTSATESSSSLLHHDLTQPRSSTAYGQPSSTVSSDDLSTVKVAACFHLPVVSSPQEANALLEELTRKIIEHAEPLMRHINDEQLRRVKPSNSQV